ncbi:MAG: carbohydrate ABC transporter permease [Clostridia bacterium]|nr:carbohydrate ABC transporter permease [Clostridia bacterium]
MKKKLLRGCFIGFVFAMILIIIAPVILTVALSFEDGGKSYINFAVWEPAHLHALVNSIGLSFITAFGAVLVSIPAAFVFAKVEFKGRGTLFYLYVIVMIMPFQVTLLPQYIVAKGIGTYDSLIALILPGIFAPFSVFLMTQNLKMLSNDVLEYARLDTSSIFHVLIYIILPLMKPAIICTSILVFSEQWNAVAEPLILIETFRNFPMAVILNEIEIGDVLGFSAATVFMAIPLLLFIIYNEELLDGMAAYQLK